MAGTFIKAFLFLSMMLIIEFSYAQNGHYWTQQYGTKSMLLSGSAIGGVSDLGAIYYNPARLSQIDNPAFLLSADVFEYSSLNITNAFGDSKNTSKSNFGSVPSLAAGSFKLPFLKGHSFGWAILQRFNSDNSFTFKEEVEDEIFADSPGEEYFNADLAIVNNLKEQWTGLSWSYPINEKFSIGASTFLSVINQGKGNFIDLQVLTSNNETAIYRFNKSFSLTHYNLIFKAGLSYKIKEATVGVTFLVPPVKLSGDGSYQYEEFLAGVEGITESPDVYATSFQDNLNTNFKSPMAIGAGITLPWKRSFIHLSGEYYGKVNEYEIISATPHSVQSNSDSVRLFTLVDNLKSVVNYGIGLEIYVSPKVFAYSSFSVDHSAAGGNLSSFASLEAKVTSSSITADYYHFGGGVVLTLKGADITVGGTYTGSKQKFDRPFNFPDDNDDKFFNSGEQATLRWNRWRFVFSFSLPFLKEKTKKIEENLGL